MLDHFGNVTEINPLSPQEYELRLRRNAREQAHAALKEFLASRKSANPAKTRRLLLDRINHLFAAPREP